MKWLREGKQSHSTHTGSCERVESKIGYSFVTLDKQNLPQLIWTIITKTG